MQVMVVQPGQHCSAARVDHLLGTHRFDAVGDLGDPLLDPDIGGPTVGPRGVANQHEASLASIKSRTRWLSDPNGADDVIGSMRNLGGTACFGSAASGSVA